MNTGDWLSFIEHQFVNGACPLFIFAAHEEGIGPRTLSRLTGVPYSIVQRATSDTIRYGNNVCDSIPGDEEYDTYLDDSEYEKCPEY